LGKAPEAYQTKPQHVKAALILKKQGVDLKAGDRIRFIKIGKKPNVKPVQLTTDREVDVNKYIEHLRTTFDQVLDPLDLEFDEIVGLTKLEQFM
jgi:DNA polymerase I